MTLRTSKAPPIQPAGRRPGLIVFDGDDTLWETMPLYTDAKHRFVRLLASWGFPEDAVRSRLEDIDYANLKRLGFARARFPQSMVDTYVEFCEQAGHVVDTNRAQSVFDIGDSVFSQPVPLLPAARDTLEKLRRDHRLVLFTKGDLDVQHARILHSGLGSLFDEVCIAVDKTRPLLEELAMRYGVPPPQVWVVGNSLKSDIQPAIEAGMRAVWIPYDTWRAEDADTRLLCGIHKCDSLSDLPGLIAKAE